MAGASVVSLNFVSSIAMATTVHPTTVAPSGLPLQQAPSYFPLQSQVLLVHFFPFGKHKGLFN